MTTHRRAAITKGWPLICRGDRAVGALMFRRKSAMGAGAQPWEIAAWQCERNASAIRAKYERNVSEIRAQCERNASAMCGL
ncbi:MAG: hypothetical protein NTZ50_09710 [Chloroflexi bacterium]|nr:hypothetical protein [Chloroflexota bacterium]